MDRVTLAPLGALEIERPTSWTALADLTVGWPTEPEHATFRARLLRCSAAALGLVLADERLTVPTYRPASLDIVAYGEAVLEVLLPRRVQLSEILREGRQVADWLASGLPSEAEVVEQVNFTDAEAQVI